MLCFRYDQLRLKLFEEYLNEKKKEGDVRKTLLEKLVASEEKLRMDGNHASLAKLCKETFGVRMEFPNNMILRKFN